MAKIIVGPKDWDKVYLELENEVIKTSSYDNLIIQFLGDVKEKSIIDYGSGPGVIAKALTDLGAKVDIYDINRRILEMACKRINHENIIYAKQFIKKDFYDFVLCNLVVCIVEHDEVSGIVNDVYNALNPKTGIAFIGFCNPKIYNVHESILDIRHSGNLKYDKNHMYLKEKKEGEYVIPEMHRPIEWYEKTFKDCNLKIVEKIFTNKYIFKNHEINDFIIFKLSRSK